MKRSRTPSGLKSVGFDEFGEYRRQMLDRYDSEKRKTTHAPVQVWHGEVAEAEFRKWLRSFLPERFGVTRGSVVPAMLGTDYELREHDVIIYDKNEAHVLWKKGAPSCWPCDEAKGIPAENVYAVFEVKATLTGAHAADALDKLQEVNVFRPVGEADGASRTRVKPNFFCGVVFFELKVEDQRRSSILDKLISTNLPFGYFGGLVLRAQRDTLGCSGRIDLSTEESPWDPKPLPLYKDLKKLKFKPVDGTRGIKIPPHGGTLLVQVLSENDILKQKTDESSTRDPKYAYHYEKAYSVYSKPIPCKLGLHLYASLTWSKSAFARFAFEVTERLMGTYSPRRRSSLHGAIFDGRLGGWHP